MNGDEGSEPPTEYTLPYMCMHSLAHLLSDDWVPACKERVLGIIDYIKENWVMCPMRVAMASVYRSKIESFFGIGAFDLADKKPYYACIEETNYHNEHARINNECMNMLRDYAEFRASRQDMHVILLFLMAIIPDADNAYDTECEYVAGKTTPTKLYDEPLIWRVINALIRDRAEHISARERLALAHYLHNLPPGQTCSATLHQCCAAPQRS